MGRLRGIQARTQSARRGFTLVEIMVATVVSGVVFSGILASYLFVGRNLTRLVNLQQQEVASRGALRQLAADVSVTTGLTTATSTQLTMTVPTASGSTTVTYTYSSAAATLTRTASSTTRTLLSNLTAFTFTYYNEGGTAVTSEAQSVKSIEVSFTSALGTAASGTRTTYSTGSSRILLRNRPLMQ